MSTPHNESNNNLNIHNKESAMSASMNPFDPERLRLNHSCLDDLGIKKLVTHIPVRRPGAEVFFRVHPDPGFRLTTGILELREDREHYLVEPSLWPSLQSEPTFAPRILVTTITTQGNIAIWPLKLSRDRANSWNDSAQEAAKIAETQWVRMTSNMYLGAYDITTAGNGIAEPVWPDLTFTQILEKAFRTSLIETLEHPVLRRLRGETQ